MIWFTLLFWMLIPATLICALGAIAALGVGIEEDANTMLSLGILGIFVFVFLCWSVWVVYPFTALAIG